METDHREDCPRGKLFKKKVIQGEAGSRRRKMVQMEGDRRRKLLKNKVTPENVTHRRRGPQKKVIPDEGGHRRK